MDQLPVGKIDFNVEFTHNEIPKTTNDAQIGYFVEKDLNHPVNLHDDTETFPLPLPKKLLKMIGWTNTNLS